MSPDLKRTTNSCFFHSSGHWQVSQMRLQRIWIHFFPKTSDDFISSAGKLSSPGDFPLLSSLMAFSTSAKSGGGSGGMGTSGGSSDSVDCDSPSGKQNKSWPYSFHLFMISSLSVRVSLFLFFIGS